MPGHIGSVAHGAQPGSNPGAVDAEGFDSSRFRNVTGDGWWRGMAEQKLLRAGVKIAHPGLSGQLV